MMFRDQVGILTDWFKGWNECEQTVALLSLLKRVSRTQARFLHICLDHWLADCTEIHILEAEANNAGTLALFSRVLYEHILFILHTTHHTFSVSFLFYNSLNILRVLHLNFECSSLTMT